MSQPTFPSLFRRIARIVSIAGALSLLGVASTASAVDTESYAVVALVGDELSLVTYHPSVGSSLDLNRSTHLANTDYRYDRLATQVSLNTIHRALPGAELQGVRIASRAPFADPDTLFVPGGSLPALIDAVKTNLKDKDTHYLVVISKFRSDAHLQINSGTIGSGKLSGLGFYIDTVTKMSRTDTGESGRGFLAPFAYVLVTLIDLRTGTVIRSEPATEGHAIANAGPNTAGSPWDLMPADRKAALLDSALRRALVRTVPHVIAPT